MITAVAGGVVDVHAHWLPRELFTLPPGASYGALTDRAGELHLGEVPLSIAATALSDVPAIRDDMRRARVGVRVLSAPPFAFPVGDAGAGADAGDYVASFNESLAAVVGESDGALAGLGLVGLHDPDRVREELATLAVTPGIAGVAIPPLLRGDSLDRGVLREVVVGAAELDLAVLVHPMQLPRPEWSSYYLANLIGNPTETATAVASLLLSGLAEELPLLRICFVHGGGSAPPCSAGGSTPSPAGPTSPGRPSADPARASGSCSWTPSRMTRTHWICWSHRPAMAGSWPAATTRSTWPNPIPSPSPWTTACPPPRWRPAAGRSSA